MADRRFAFAIPGDIDAPTGGYAYDRRILAGATAAGWQATHVALPGGFPAPTPADLAEAARRLAALDADLPVVIDGLALGAMPEVAARVAGVRPLVALVHHPLALETGLAPADAGRLAASERAALAVARAVVVTSPATADILVADYGVPRARVTVAPPGTQRVAPARGSGGPGVAILSVGTLVGRKGHPDLIAALAGLAHLDWRLTIVGSADLDPAHAAEVRAAIAAAGLDARIRLAGAVPAADLAGHYDRADLFVLASHYEGYGMAYTEALAHGLPVVATRGAAVAEAVAAGAVLADAGDPDSLRLALAPLLSDPAARRAAADRAAAAARTLPGWDDTTRLFTAALEGLA